MNPRWSEDYKSPHPSKSQFGENRINKSICFSCKNIFYLEYSEYGSPGNASANCLVANCPDMFCVLKCTHYDKNPETPLEMLIEELEDE